VVITARGHHRITATHAKTFELAAHDDIGAEATCVIGVGAQADWDALARLHGPVAITVEAAGRRAVVQAEATPFWSAGAGLVVRKSDYRGADTLAIECDASAADLDRELATALTQDGAPVVVTVRPTDDAPPSAALFTDRFERLADGMRAFTDATPDAVVAAGQADVVLARPGLPAVAAGRALLGVDGDVVLVGPWPRGKRARQQRWLDSLARASALAVVTTGPAWKDLVADVSPMADDDVATAVLREGEVVAPVRMGLPEQRLNAEDRVVAVVRSSAVDPATGGSLGPLLQALLAEGVSTRTLRQAVANVPALAEEWSYESIIGLQDR
jgi:hypothetical protein